MNPEVNWLCSSDEMCKDHLKYTPVPEGQTDHVYKCGSPDTYKLSLKSDFVENDENIFFNIIGFEDFFKAFLLIF
jgi:hypothetical protein